MHQNHLQQGSVDWIGIEMQVAGDGLRLHYKTIGSIMESLDNRRFKAYQDLAGSLLP